MIPNQTTKLSSNSIVRQMYKGGPEETAEVTKESIKVGSFVSWNSSGGRARGKIERVSRDGSIKVPDSDFTINGDSENPAALIRVYRKGPDGWEKTDRLVGHKFTALSEIDSLTKMEDEDDVEKHGTHDQSSHGKGGGKGGAPKLKQPTTKKPSRVELREKIKDIKRQKKDVMAEKSGLEREISQAEGQSRMASSASARSSAKAKLPGLTSRLSQVNENISDLDQEVADTETQISETGFFD